MIDNYFLRLIASVFQAIFTSEYILYELFDMYPVLGCYLTPFVSCDLCEDIQQQLVDHRQKDKQLMKHTFAETFIEKVDIYCRNSIIRTPSALPKQKYLAAKEFEMLVRIGAWEMIRESDRHRKKYKLLGNGFTKKLWSWYATEETPMGIGGYLNALNEIRDWWLKLTSIYKAAEEWINARNQLEDAETGDEVHEKVLILELRQQQLCTIAQDICYELMFGEVCEMIIESGSTQEQPQEKPCRNEKRMKAEAMNILATVYTQITS